RLRSVGPIGIDIDGLLVRVGRARRNDVDDFVALLLGIDHAGEGATQQKPRLRVFGVELGGLLEHWNGIFEIALVAIDDSSVLPAARRVSSCSTAGGGSCAFE